MRRGRSPGLPFLDVQELPSDCYAYDRVLKGQHVLIEKV